LKKNASSIVFAVIWLLLVTSLLCTPGTKFPKITWEDKIWLDKWIHIFLFMILVILWSKAYSYKKNVKSDRRKAFFKIMVVGCLYGIAMELVQNFIHSVHLTWDITAWIGCIAGYFFKKIFSR
jgi:hypothetical protein